MRIKPGKFVVWLWLDHDASNPFWNAGLVTGSEKAAISYINKLSPAIREKYKINYTRFPSVPKHGKVLLR